jgi:hypothetical protein
MITRRNWLAQSRRGQVVWDADKAKKGCTQIMRTCGRDCCQVAFAFFLFVGLSANLRLRRTKWFRAARMWHPFLRCSPSLAPARLLRGPTKSLCRGRLGQSVPSTVRSRNRSKLVWPMGPRSDASLGLGVRFPRHRTFQFSVVLCDHDGKIRTPEELAVSRLGPD